MAKTKLSVNINKLATLRNARGGNDPDILKAAEAIQSFGAHGITVHPRPDERHIRKQDVYDLKPIVTTEYNIEGYPSDDFISLVNEIRPDQVTLVPDPPHVLTSNAGWLISENKEILKNVFRRLEGLRISVFIDPKTGSDEDQLKLLRDLGAHRIELYTEAYAKSYETQVRLDETLSSYCITAERALKNGLKINAGHDLNQFNLGLFVQKVPDVAEVSIGHALISEALYEGLQTTITKYLDVLKHVK